MKVKNRFLTFIFICLFVFCSCLPFYSLPFAKASHLTSFVYARVVTSNVYLYKTTNPISSNIYFEIPNTYFVLLIADFNDLFYKAQYRDVVGYVLKTDVVPVAETPENPYLEDYSVYVFSSDGLNIMSTPNESAYLVTTTSLYTPLSFYGEKSGFEKTQGRGDTWYFIKVNDTFGYVYAGLCEDSNERTLNLEITTPIENPFLDNDNSYLYNLVNLTPGLTILLVILVSIPSLILLFLMFRPILPEKYLKSKRPIVHRRERKSKTLKQIENLGDDSTL